MVLEDSDVEMIVAEIEVSVSRFMIFVAALLNSFNWFCGDGMSDRQLFV